MSKFDIEEKLFGKAVISRITECDDINELKRYINEAFGMMNFHQQISLASVVANTDVKELAQANIQQMKQDIGAAGYQISERDGWSVWDFRDGEEASSDFSTEEDAIIDAYTDLLLKADIAAGK